MQHHSDHLVLGYSLCTVAIACLLAVGISLLHSRTCTVCVKKSKHCYPTLPYFYLYVPFATLRYTTFTYPYCYPWVPYCYLLYSTTTACCCGNCAVVAVRALNDYDYSYINMLLFKAHCLPHVVQCRFVAGIYSALLEGEIGFYLQVQPEKVSQVPVYKLT